MKLLPQNGGLEVRSLVKFTLALQVAMEVHEGNREFLEGGCAKFGFEVHGWRVRNYKGSYGVGLWKKINMSKIESLKCS